MKVLITLTFVLALFLTNMVLADENDVTKSIQTVIVSQLTALKNGDGRAAWVHAHPSIKAQFNSPERFMAMVERGYSPLINFVQMEFFGLIPDEGIWVQMVRLQDERGLWYDLMYALIETQPGRFQIAGVSLEQANGI